MYWVSRICIGCGCPIYMSNTYRTSLYTYTQYILWLSNTYVQVFSKTYTYPNIYENMYWIYVLDRIYIYWVAQHVYWVCLGEHLCYPIHIKRCCPIHMECCPRHIPNIYFAYPRHIWVKIRENPYMYWATPHMYLQCLSGNNVLGNIIYVLGIYIGVHHIHLGQHYIYIG